MSVLFYRRPDYYNKPSGPINSSDCARYVERAKRSERSIPDGLGFEDVINHKSLPPCSLNDFMDYLVYVEHNAENLQFYLWYQDYVQRFNALPTYQQALSPEWTPARKTSVPSTKETAPISNSRAKRETLAAMLKHGYNARESTLFGDDPMTKARPLSVVKDGDDSEVAQSITPSSTTAAEVATQAGLKWQPFTIQPGRDEVNRILRHYLAFTAPRELNLSHRDRANCLHALQHTTHPSAFIPAITIAEAALRDQSHPNFIRWSICNGNKPRVVFVRGIGIACIFAGFATVITLTLSSVSRWWRLLSAIPFFLGISTLVAAYKGLCIILHHSHSRNLRPWEIQPLVVADEAQNPWPPSSEQHHTFGPKNSGFEEEEEGWYARYEGRRWWRKVFEESVWTRDEALRGLQDGIILGANVWAVVGTVGLVGGFIGIKEVGLF